MAVAYKSAGAGAATETSAADLAAPCPATVDAGDILIAHVCHRTTTTAPSTPSDWRLLSGPHDAGTVVTGRYWVYGKIADGSEDGASVSFGTEGGAAVRHARIYSFSGYVSGDIDRLALGFTTTVHARQPQMPTVTTTETGDLAIALVYMTDDNDLIPSTGESGGDWTEAVAEFKTTLGTDGAMQLQTATPTADPGTISGGSCATASDPVGVIGIELRSTAGAAALRVSVLQATESGAAQTNGKSKSKATGQRTETDLAQVTGKSKLKAVAEVLAAAELAQRIIETKSYRAKQPLETDATQAVGKLKVKSVTQPSATEAALTVTPSRAFPVGQATEADTPGNIAAGELRPVGDSQESDSALPIAAGRVYPLGQASSLSSALGALPVLTRRIDVVQAIEADSAGLIGLARAYAPAQAVEVGVAMRIGAVLAVAVGQVEEASTAQSITPAKTYAVGLVRDASAASALTSSKVAGVNSTESVESTLTAGAHKVYQLGQVVEQDSAQLVSGKGVTLIPVAQATEVDTALLVKAPIKVSVGQVTEAGTAGSVAPLKSMVVRLVAEMTLSQTILSIHRKALTQVRGSNFAQPVGKLRSVTLSEALSAEEADALASIKALLLGLPTESNFALGVSDRPADIFILIGEPESLEDALAVLRKARTGSGAVSTEEVGQVVRLSEPVASGSASSGSSGAGLASDERVGSSRTSTEPVGGTE